MTFRESAGHLHLRVDHSGVLALPVDMVHLGEVVLLPQGGVEDVVEVDGQDVQEPRGTCRGGSMMRIKTDVELPF